jgi:hypothetical protein
MKIVQIVQNGNIFEVTKKPTFFERMIGLVERVERYKDIGAVYHYFGDIRAYITEDGEVLGPFHKMTKVLECWRRRF